MSITNGANKFQRRHLARLIRRGQNLVQNQAFGTWYQPSNDCACAGGMAVLAHAEENGIDPLILKRNGGARLGTYRDQLPVWMRQFLTKIVTQNDVLRKPANQIASEIEAGLI